MKIKENAPLVDRETELQRLSKLDSNFNKLKACLFNLVVYTNEPQRISHFKEIVQMIMQTFPCRVIFIQGDASAIDSYLHIHLSTEGLPNSQGVLCDQIVIEAAGSYLSRVPFLILPRFIPDLPIYLLWGLDPTTETTLLPYLQKFATRLIFDSESIDNLQCFSHRMLDHLESSRMEIVDMNWARIGGWREVLAQTFDNQERIRQLSSSRYIKILYNDHSELILSHPETQALYFQAWLAAQLGWKYERMERQDNKIHLCYQSKEHLHDIILQSQRKEDLPPEEIIAIEISNQEDYFCTLKRQEGTQVIIYYSNQYECLLPFTLMFPNLRSGRSFMQEVFYQKPSQQYIRMLRLISLIKGD